jgi:hypothetical protein
MKRRSFIFKDAHIITSLKNQMTKIISGKTSCRFFIGENRIVPGEIEMFL